MKGLRWILWLAILACASAPAARAATVPIPRQASLDVETVAGGEAILLAPNDQVLSRVDAHGHLTTVLDLRSQRTRYVERVAGSGRWLAVVTGPPDAVGGTGTLLVGPPSGPLQSVSGCEALADPIALSDTAAAYFQGACGAGASQLMLADLRGAAPAAGAGLSPAAVPDPPPSLSGNAGLSLAGDLVAYAAGGQIVVRDWTSGAIVSTVTPEAPLTFCGGATEGSSSVCAFAVDSDGSVWQLVDSASYLCDAQCQSKYSTGPSLVYGCTGHLDRSPVGGTPTSVASSVCNSEIFVAGGRALVYRGPSTAAATGVWEASATAAPQSLGAAVPLYAFTGSAVSYSTLSCTAEDVITATLPLAAPIPGWTVPSRCTVSVKDATLRLGRHPSLALTVRCPRGCLGPVSVSLPIGTGRVLARTAGFTLDAAGSRKLSIHLSGRNALLRAAAKHSRIQVEFSASAYGEDPSLLRTVASVRVR